MYVQKISRYCLEKLLAVNKSRKENNLYGFLQVRNLRSMYCSGQHYFFRRYEIRKSRFIFMWNVWLSIGDVKYWEGLVMNWIEKRSACGVRARKIVKMRPKFLQDVGKVSAAKRLPLASSCMRHSKVELVVPVHRRERWWLLLIGGFAVIAAALYGTQSIQHNTLCKTEIFQVCGRSCAVWTLPTLGRVCVNRIMGPRRSSLVLWKVFRTHPPETSSLL